MKCKYEPCTNEAQGASEYCSKSCRAQQSRRNKSSATSEAQQTVTPVGRTGFSITQEPNHVDKVILKAFDIEQLVRSRTEGCKVAIPGDEDYVGCVVDGKVVKLPKIPVKDMTRVQLDQAIREYPHDQWINSPEHRELMSRLNTMTVPQLEAEGYHVPAWKAGRTADEVRGLAQV